MNFTLSLSTLLSLVSALAILIYFDEGTLFLAALLLGVISIKTINSKIAADNFKHEKCYLTGFLGLWFALSIAPAFGVPLNETTNLGNGFIVQALLTFILFIIFYITKISIIGRVLTQKRGGVSPVFSTIIAGAAAGISSSALWQIFLKMQEAF